MKRERGSAAVELAMVLPLVAIAAAAVVQVGVFARDAAVVAHGAREGARQAAVSSDDALVRDVVLTRSGLPPAATDVTVRRGVGGGGAVEVAVRYRAPHSIPLVSWLFSSALDMKASAIMRQETDDR